jgi:hypothetical protein
MLPLVVETTVPELQATGDDGGSILQTDVEIKGALRAEPSRPNRDFCFPG